ncbi:NAD(P)/FAD-dependent oxidoreductase [Natrinema hispanicum]|uniref:2-polyprenyl-6-methoxyphenol hydroxylase n=1 Tax=Natrinema hispanicum TaxID=392421 RepID=A0A1G6ID06_9EURY|nr:oxidoreductase [Natrinema hispanicum]SDC03636.1 2-polyprenyl-6-methoxyphenol hydroxylase [Natrinema hispanicum]SES86441.1 2-polyprenyl-6-methoxyphenol hydroxylase [Natrinema hispanicum]
MTLATVPQYNSERTSIRGEHAVVLGAGMAGLLAARAVADAFDEVTIIERDSLPDEPADRRGVPQGRHVHVMLEAGKATLEDLFPGYRRDLLSAGGLEIDGACDVNFYAEGDFLADGPHHLPHYAATRPLYEQLVRHRVADCDGVELRSRCQFRDYLIDEAATTVEGVVFTNEAAAVEECDATLVIDATGRTSRTPAWLESHGYTPPPLDEVHIDLAYSTLVLQRPAADHRSFVMTLSPSHPRAAGVLPVEGDRWLVTVAGVHGDHPPTDPDGFGEFVASLPIPDIERLLEAYPRVSNDIAHYPFPSNLRHRYETLDRFPDGLVVIGDGIASFNPLYGQGMSVAALEALVLHQVLATGGLEGLAPRFFARSSEIIDVAWTMAVGSDHRFPQTTGPKPRGTGLMSRYIARLNRKAHTDGALRDAFLRVMMLERPPTTLLHPGVVWRVLQPSRRLA